MSFDNVITCPKCGRAITMPRWLWVVRWPFNFEYVDCPDCGLVETEDWLWSKLATLMYFLSPFDGLMHERPHRWWEMDNDHTAWPQP